MMRYVLWLSVKKLFVLKLLIFDSLFNRPMTQLPRFKGENKTDFYRVLIQRVDAYFIENNLSKYANSKMMVKTVVMFSLYLVPYVLILSGKLPLYAMWICTAVMGLGLAGIGMSIMHDANHGAYTASPFWNNFIGYSLNLIGGDAANWKIQHNKLHHTYTNIHGFDMDIKENAGLRFTPAVKHRAIQRIQVFYVFILYALQTFFWVLLKDFLNFFQYAKNNHDDGNGAGRVKRFLVIVSTKLFYISYALLLPYWVLDVAWWQVLIGFMTMHAVGGFVLAVVFQLAHVIDGIHFPEPDANGVIANDWAVHQLHTTANFAPSNKWLSYYVGGLNYQIEHHLFTRICHVHYPAIAPIVKQTAEEYNLPYRSHTTFAAAFASHITLLGKLGRNELQHVVSHVG